jgi:hypothetical protein
MAQIEKSWSLWFHALCELQGLAHISESYRLETSVRFDLCELAFWLAENEIDTWEQLRSADEPGSWPGAEKFSAAVLRHVTELQKRQRLDIYVLLQHMLVFVCMAGTFTLEELRGQGMDVTTHINCSRIRRDFLC